MTKYVTYRFMPGKENGSIDDMFPILKKMKHGTVKIIYDENGEPEYIEHRTDHGPGTDHWDSLPES